jgi:cytoskeletal protein CcmA (bactofilin family)
MALRIRRGTDAERQSITPAAGELIYTTDTKALYVGDGTLVGGKLLASGTTIISDIVLNSNDITGTGNIDITGNIDVTGNIHAQGNITADGNLTLGDADTDGITLNAELTSDIIPDQTDTYALGSTNNRWNLAVIKSVQADAITSNTIAGTLDGDVKGSVFGEDSTPLIDAIASRIVGPIETSENAVFTGNVDLTGATVTGDVTGDLTGNVTGNVTGDVTGDLTGNIVDSNGTTVVSINDPGVAGGTLFVGTLLGDMRGSIFGDDSTRLIDQTESSINLDGTIKGNVRTDNDNAYELGGSLNGFSDAHIRGKIYIGAYDNVNIRTENVLGLDRLSVKSGVVTRPAVTTTLNGNVQIGVSRTTVAINNDSNIQPGAIFRLPGTAELVVQSVAAGVVTTTTSWTASGGNGGDPITFYNPPRPNMVYTDDVPATGIGRSGDVAGLMVADANYIYVCRGVYDGVTEIWTRSAHVAW